MQTWQWARDRAAEPGEQLLNRMSQDMPVVMRHPRRDPLLTPGNLGSGQYRQAVGILRWP
jgi:hypothetical protein